MLFHTVYVDPPWNETGGGRIRRGADRHYPLMKTKEIAALHVWSLADFDAHLYLWVTNNHLPDGLMVMEAWGFRYVTNIAWYKIGRPGLGQYFRGQHELLLFGVRGKLPYKVVGGKRAQGRSAYHAPRGEHSEKPDVFRQAIELVSYEPRIELFARTRSPGWHVWGNEVECDTSCDHTSVVLGPDGVPVARELDD